MSDRLRRNLTLLKMLVTASPQHRKAILCTASDDLVAAISEIALNTLKGNVPISERQFQVLKKKRHIIKKLSNKRTSLVSKKRLVKQSGGFIGALLGIAIPLITSLLSRQ